VLAYGAAFAFGWFLHRRVDWLELLRRDWLLYLAVAAVSSGVALWLIGATPQLRMHALPDARRAVYAAVYNVSAWCWILGIVGGAVPHLGQPGPLWRYLADSSFFVYLVHLPVVYALQALVMRWPLHWSVKYPLIVGLATAITLALYHYLVRSTFVGTFLNGRKYPRGAAFTPAPSTFPG
jgi:peptidoglycan/LPS O-acetylase OafA/YrhL